MQETRLIADHYFDVRDDPICAYDEVTCIQTLIRRNKYLIKFKWYNIRHCVNNSNVLHAIVIIRQKNMYRVWQINKMIPRPYSVISRCQHAIRGGDCHWNVSGGVTLEIHYADDFKREVRVYPLWQANQRWECALSMGLMYVYNYIYIYIS